MKDIKHAGSYLNIKTGEWVIAPTSKKDISEIKEALKKGREALSKIFVDEILEIHKGILERGSWKKNT